MSAYGFVLNLVAVFGVISVVPGFALPVLKNSPEKSVCGAPATPISTVQGPGTVSPLAGHEVDVEAVVVGVFQKPGELGGLFVQEETRDQDRNPRTSEGLFAFTAIPAQVGERVRIRGTVREFNGLTELQPVTKLEICGDADTRPLPMTLRLPATSADLEAMENMRVTLTPNPVITDLRQLGRYGELVVSSKRLFHPTQLSPPVMIPSAVTLPASQDRLIIDDGRTGRDLPVRFYGQNNRTFFSADNPIRAGQEITDLEGILHYGFGDYRVQPVRPLLINETANPRTPHPDPVGGTLRVSVFNVSNYFSTPDSAGPVCGPLRNRTCRGARNPQEQKRQLQKLTAALLAVDADILALIELENNTEQSLRNVTDALNSVSGHDGWRYVLTGSFGQDVIKSGLLFKPATVTAKGLFAIQNHAIDPHVNDALNRPALAQTFRLRQNGELLTVIVAHLKSRSCHNAEGPDEDQNDGQACFNHTRTDAAAALADWSLADPTGSGSKRVLVLGDFNSYPMENPIRVMQEKGLINLSIVFQGLNSYTYIYNGLAGTLDHALADPELSREVTGITVWHINADEPAILDYRDESHKPVNYHAGSPFRSSDHDPVIIGIALESTHTPYENRQSAEDSATLRYTLLAGVLLMLITGARGLRKK